LRTCWVEQNIPCLRDQCAVRLDFLFELTVGETTVALFPWREGVTLPPTPSSAEAARLIGLQMGRIHRFALDASKTSDAGTEAHPEEEWADLAGEAKAEGVIWADALAEARPDLIRWGREAQEAMVSLGTSQMWTHRDLDQKNVLWSDAVTPWLLDWEGAGPLAPALEVMGTALNWAGQAAGRPSAEPFFAFVQGYREARPVSVEDLRLASQAVPDKWLAWLKFNMKRSLARAQAGPDERAMACGAAAHSLATLYSLGREAPMRLGWCEQC